VSGAVRIAVAAVALALATLVAAAAAPTTYPFSHAAHAGRDPSSMCVDCHDLESTQPSGAPSLRAGRCAFCHDDVPAPSPRAVGPGARTSLAVRFDHGAHAAAITNACATCHRAIVGAAPNHVEHALVATSGACFQCHDADRRAAAPLERACTACHGRDERAIRPVSHSAVWPRQHGSATIPFGSLVHDGARCTLCHKESSCSACHRVERPRDHGAAWGTRLHGINASFDGARCKTCHETGECIACHRTTEPSNHAGAWRQTHGLVARTQTDASCRACHRVSFCIDCHRGRK
jgi:hypothetical protein